MIEACIKIGLLMFAAGFVTGLLTSEGFWGRRQRRIEDNQKRLIELAERHFSKGDSK